MVTGDWNFQVVTATLWNGTIDEHGGCRPEAGVAVGDTFAAGRRP